MRRRRRRLPRILLNAATAVSLVLCAATATLWVRSWIAWDGIAYTRQKRIGASGWSYEVYGLESGCGGVAVHHYEARSKQREEGSGAALYHLTEAGAVPVKRTTGWDFEWVLEWGPLWFSGAPDDRIHGLWRAVIPYWLVTLATGIPVARALVGWAWNRHRKRAGRAVCASCGYDLRATPDRCPECGAVPPPPLPPPPSA
jgi:hypothetical protein